MDDRLDEKYSNILEGMFRGITKRIKEAQDSLEKEYRYGASQQGFSHDALTEEIKTGVEKLLTEIKYLAQQNIDIYDYTRKEHAKMQEELLKEIERQNAALLNSIDEKLRLLTIPQPVPAVVDYDLLAEKVAAILGHGEEQPEETVGEAAAADGTETEQKAEGEYFDDSNFAYDVLAEKIASILPEPDYDLVVDKLVAALPHVDAESVAEQVAALIRNDPEAIASEIADQIPLTDYELIGEKLAAALQEHDFTPDDEFADRVARRVAELLGADDRDLDRLVEESAVTPLEELAAAAENAAEEEQEKAPKAAKAPVSPVAPVVLPVVEDESKMLRYKRSFVAKIIGSDEDVKGYYSDLKNAILAYGKVRSQINWTNDRFSIGNESVIKIGMRGKTLVMYLALDPAEFPETVYHQKFAGDTKMYESTPMMVKIKTKAAVKKSIRLIDLCMERYGAVKEEREAVDYAAQYFFRTDEELLAEGLIKTAIVVIHERADPAVGSLFHHLSSIKETSFERQKEQQQGKRRDRTCHSERAGIIQPTKTTAHGGTPYARGNGGSGL